MHESIHHVRLTHSERPHAYGFKHASRGILFRFYGVALPESDLRETFYERTFPGYSRFVRPDVPALRSMHDYDNNVHNSTIYS